jgi:uncharacterized protein YqjF (DUF2071 family)
MTWANLAFLHWPMPADALRAKLPPGLELDTHEATAWLGITPFEMRHVRVTGGPRFPTAVDFPELNVRTYVTHNGRAGVFFFSLDAASLLAVIGARAATGLPYFHARMTSRPVGQGIEYASDRRAARAPKASLRVRYAPAGDVFTSTPGSLEHFLTERYALFVKRGSKIHRLDIEHVPWPLQNGFAEVSMNSMAQAAGLTLPDEKPHVLFCRQLQVVAHWPRPA